jgi:hypothetical protein
VVILRGGVTAALVEFHRIDDNEDGTEIWKISISKLLSEHRTYFV